jgi:RNA polymerase sigma factor (sigma-70 family)
MAVVLDERHRETLRHRQTRPFAPWLSRRFALPENNHAARSCLVQSGRKNPVMPGAAASIVEPSDAPPTEPENAAVLFGKYKRYVAKIGNAILGRHDDVEDVIQDVFLAVHHDLHKLRDAACTKGWIATITVRIARQRVSERLLQQRIRELPAIDLEAAANPAASAEHKADLSGMLQVMLKMPPMLIAAWLLKHVEDEPLGRIAMLCGCSESTAQRRIRSVESSMRGAETSEAIRGSTSSRRTRTQVRSNSSH